ncbi:MAG: polyprenyl synthetase family protein [Eubacteriales bacterium]|nr:polyprenyl synthetase family protein [Eubacteriales bacterium]
MKFSERLAMAGTLVDGWVNEALASADEPAPILLEAMRYAACNGGKRIRPVFLRETYKLFQKEETPSVKHFSVALELIHCFSLVHDDLPAMDDDDLRRGKPATHKVYGEDMGILTGDALLNHAYEEAVSSFFADDLPAQRKVRALQILARKTGRRGMIGGQVLDIHLAADADVDRLTVLCGLKTGALLEAAFMIGATLGGADTAVVADMERAAAKVGLAFQMKDDILDVTGDEITMGKRIGSDSHNAHVTFAARLGIEAAEETVRRLTEEAIVILRQYTAEDDFVIELVRALCTRKK